ncbi:hypothetical protein KP509_12G056000 [Ceratopteris richardii]|nr:hypothetical protein KP509_12G056000 [Ceratopteris richardii]
MQEDGDSYSAAFSDSEVSNVKDERKAAFVRSTSHKHSEATHTLKYMQKGQNRNRSDVYKGSMEEALHNIERLKHGSRSPRVSDYQQLPRIHDVHAVEIATKLDASHSTDKVLCRLSNVGSTGTTRLVVQGGKLVGMWGSGAMRDASTDVSPQVSKSRRDMGTQMTPAGSSKNTPGSSPERKGRAPARHSTPNPASIHAANKSDQGHILAEMNDVEKARMNQVSDTVVSSSTMSPSGSNASIANRWKRLQDSLSVGGISEQPSLPLNKELHSPMLKAQDVEPSHEKLEDNAAPPTQNAAWEEERSKYVSKFAREEARIDAWENHQKAKAEAELKKLEMKLERLRAQATEKIMNKMAAAHLRAEEMRATARAHQAEQLAKALERANSLSKRGSGYLSESLGVCFSIMP